MRIFSPMRRIRTALQAALLGLGVVTLSLGAAADSAGAQAFVEKEHGAIRKLVEANAPQAEVTKVIDSMMNFQEIAQRSLGSPCPSTVPNCTNHWAELNDTQKAEVTDLFKQLVEKKIRENAYKTKDFDVTYRGAKEQGESISRVKTEAKNKTKPRDPAVQVDYIIKCDPSCSVIDSINEGSILTKNYYDQSHKMLTTQGQGYAYFTQKLRDKIAKK